MFRTQTPRAQRFPLKGSVRLFVPFPPFRLGLTLVSTDISTTGLRAALDPTAVEKSLGHTLPTDLVRAGQRYDLQIEPEDADLPGPLFVEATLSRQATKDESGRLCWDLSFHFQPEAWDIATLCQSLSSQSIAAPRESTAEALR